MGKDFIEVINTTLYQTSKYAVLGILQAGHEV